MSKETGGPAFPFTEANGANSGDVGMTLRDYFAAKALIAYYSDGNSADAASAARWSYAAADAMLKERVK